MTNQPDQHSSVVLACPVCHAELVRDKHAWVCNSCGKVFTNTVEGYANFLTGEGYADEDDVERGFHEEKTATVTIEGYLIPLLQKNFPIVSRPRFEYWILAVEWQRALICCVMPVMTPGGRIQAKESSTGIAENNSIN